MYHCRGRSFFPGTSLLENLLRWLSRGVRYLMRISGVSLKNGSRPLWIPSDDNDRFGFRVEARSVTVARNTRRRRFGWRDERWSVEPGKEDDRESLSMRKPLLRDTDGRYPGGGGNVKHVERKARGRRDDDASCAIARIEQPSTFGANFFRASGTSTREESKGCASSGMRGWMYHPHDFSQTLATFDHRRPLPFPRLPLPLPLIAFYRGDEPPVASLRVWADVKSRQGQRRKPRTDTKMRGRILHHVCR